MSLGRSGPGVRSGFLEPSWTSTSSPQWIGGPRSGGSRRVGSVPVFVSESALVAEIVLLIMGALGPDSRQPHCVHEPVAIT